MARPLSSPDFEYSADDGQYEESRRNPSPPPSNRILRDILGRWQWLALGLVVGLLGSAYYLAKTPKTYTAQSTLLIKQQTSSVMSIDQVEEIDPRSVEAMNTIAARIQRADLLERVASRQDVRDLSGLMPEPAKWLPEWLPGNLTGREKDADKAGSSALPAPAVLGGMIWKWLDVSIRRGTRLMDVTITHQVPEVSKALADAISREYLAETATTRMAGRSSSIDLLQKESDEARSKLQASSSALATYARTLETVKRLDAKEAEATALRRRYLPKHPKFIAASAELTHFRENFVQEFEIARQAPSDKNYWEFAGKQLSDPGTSKEDFVRTARQQLLARIGVLENEILSATTVFNSMLTRIQEWSVNRESEESSVEVSSLARLPGLPTAPVPVKVYATGGMAGLASGLLIALLACRLDRKFHTAAQLVAETGGNILAAVAFLDLKRIAVAEHNHEVLHPDRTPTPQDDWDERLIFRPGVSATPYAEMYRVLRASVSLLGDEASARKVTLFSSALPGEGKTLVSANFALASAAQGRKTLLIDLDLRRPSVHRMFGMKRDTGSGGVTDCLANHAFFSDVIVTETGLPNLHLILSGKRSPNPGELLHDVRIKTLLLQACREYDVVVLDSAPILAVPDTRILAPLADNFCLVVRAAFVSKSALRRLMDVLDEDGTPYSGIVFNGYKEKRRLMNENYTHGYYGSSSGGYGAYGTYGEIDDDDHPPKTRRKPRRKHNNKTPAKTPA